MCNNWPDFTYSLNWPYSVYGGTGGFIGNTAIICGGWGGSDYVQECYSLTSEKATLVSHMSVGRKFAASIVYGNTLWVTGGKVYNGDGMDSTEYVTVTGSTPGPDLPMALFLHAIAAINNTCSMVIGGRVKIYVLSSYGYMIWNGYTDDSALTFYYDHIEDKWTNGTSLMQARSRHAAGIVTDEETDENFVAVTGGYGLDYTELLQDGEWVQGKINDTI
jgi:hypothetical protein